MMQITRKENGINVNTNAKKSILRLLGTPARYIRCKIRGIYRKLVKKTDNNGGKQKNKSKWIDKLRIKNMRNTIDSNTIDNNTIDNTINNITIDNNTNETYDSKVSDKIRGIRVMLSRLGNIVTKMDKKKIKLWNKGHRKII